MSYAVYTTQGWILGSAPTGEASKVYWLYTRDFGLVHARAQGVRLLSSKLRYNLADYGLCDLSLVRGKEFWRLTGATALSVDEQGRLPRARVLNLVRRLVQGEEKNEKLFEALSRLSERSVSETDALCEVLSALGYLDLRVLIGKGEREKILAINKALKETQL